MPVSYRKTLTVSAASTNGVAASQTPGAAGDLVLASATVTVPNGGQRIQIISAANLSARTFVVYGTEKNTGRTQTYSTIGPNATTLILPITFATVTRISVDAGTGAALTVGWAAQGDLGPMPINARANPSDVGFSCVITSGTPTYTARFTMGDVQDATLNPGSLKWFDHPIIVSQTADSTGNYGKPTSAGSLYASGVCTMDYVQIEGGW